MEYSFIKAENNEHYQCIADMALELFPQVYAAWVDMEMILYFVDQFQSFEAIKEQAATDFEYYLIVSEADERSVGYLGLQFLPHEMKLSKLYLMPDGQGKGLGDRSMEMTFDRFYAKGYKRMSLFVNENNDRAINFYKKHGFYIEDTVVQSFDNGHSVVDHLMVFVVTG